jgi:hypothetical protein
LVECITARNQAHNRAVGGKECTIYTDKWSTYGELVLDGYNHYHTKRQYSNRRGTPSTG